MIDLSNQMSERYRNSSIKTRVDYTGQKFNHWTVIKLIQIGGYKSSIWLCRCDCGFEAGQTISSIKNYSKQCRKCSTKITRKKRYKGTKYISGTTFNAIKHKAKIRNLDFDVDIHFLSNLIVEQQFKCALTGREINTLQTSGKAAISASLDRIDSTKGYLKNNVQWVHKDVNTMKWDFEQGYFIDTCKQISKKTNNRLSFYEKLRKLPCLTSQIKEY